MLTAARIIVAILSAVTFTLLAIGWRVADPRPPSPASGVCLIIGDSCASVGR